MSALFWLATAVLALALMALVVAGLRRPRVPVEPPDLTLYRGQLDELARDLAAGRLAPADLHRRLAPTAWGARRRWPIMMVGQALRPY